MHPDLPSTVLAAHDQERTINTKEAAADTRSGMDDAALIRKYNLSAYAPLHAISIGFPAVIPDIATGSKP
jgi:hypothetical protein